MGPHIWSQRKFTSSTTKSVSFSSDDEITSVESTNDPSGDATFSYVKLLNSAQCEVRPSPVSVLPIRFPFDDFAVIKPSDNEVDW